jgi:3-phosphoglycerate kinase
MGVINKLLTIADSMLVGGGVANTFLKAGGMDIKKSIFDEEAVSSVQELSHDKIKLPQDFVWRDDAIVDIGSATQQEFSAVIASAKTIIWNGPMGMIEEAEFQKGTLAVYNAIVGNSGAHSVVGGGHTIGTILKQPGHGKISHISTGGGAMLEYIEKGTLPGIEALSKSAI